MKQLNKSNDLPTSSKLRNSVQKKKKQGIRKKSKTTLRMENFDLHKSTTEKKNSWEKRTLINNSKDQEDCILIDETQEIIVIDDDDDDDEEISVRGQTGHNQLLKPITNLKLIQTNEAENQKMPNCNEIIISDVKSLNKIHLSNEKSEKIVPMDSNDVENVIKKVQLNKEKYTLDADFLSLELSKEEMIINSTIKIDESKLLNFKNRKISNNKIVPNKKNELRKFYNDAEDLLNRVSHSSLRSEEESRNLSTQNDSIISITDETLIYPNNDTNEQSTSILEDNSVIFVSESIDLEHVQASTALDYIPLSSSPEPYRTYKTNNNSEIHKKNAVTRDLLTAREQKKMDIYNSNSYNPNKDKDEPLKAGKRMVLIDGSNVAYHHALNKTFSVKGLEICLDYFEKMNYEVKAIVPQFRLQKYKSTDPNRLEELHKLGKIVFTPCKSLPGKNSISYDDRFILQLAAELDAAVVSNDNYRDLIHENPAFKKIIENRVIGYTWCNDLFILPKDPYGRHGPTLSMILNRT